jgi:hypothetical protein
MYFIISSLNMLTVHCRYRYFWQHLYQWCGAADNEIFHVELVVFRLTVGRLESLIISVCLFWVLDWVTLISVPHSCKVGVKINCTQTVFMLIEKQRKMFFITLDVFASYFLIKNFFFHYFLTVRTPVYFLTLPLHSKIDTILFPSWCA